MKSIWSGSITFGLVNIPIKLYSAKERAHEIDFNMLHAADGSPIRYARICEKEDYEVPYAEIVKGVDAGGGNYVMIEQKEIENALPRKTKNIEILAFCDSQEIDPIYFERPYYLEADKQSDKAYQLFLKTLELSNKVGIAKFVLKTKEHLSMIRPYKGFLLLQELSFYEEIADMSPLRLPIKAEISVDELSIATKLVGQLSKKFDPSDFHDTFTKDMRTIIKKKIAGKEILPAERFTPTETKNLIEALSLSLKEQSGGARKISRQKKV